MRLRSGVLAGANNYELVQLALEPKEQNKFDLRGGMLLLRKRLVGMEKNLPESFGNVPVEMSFRPEVGLR